MPDTRPPAMFVADAPALDFLNTVAMPAGTQVDWLANGDDLLNWLALARLARSDVLDDMRRTAGPGELDAVAAQARALRAWLRAFVLQHKGQRLTRAAMALLEPLNNLLASDEIYGQLEPRAGEGSDISTPSDLQFVPHRRWRNPDALLLPIAKAMADLLSASDFTHVKACEGPGCTLLFLDTTRGHMRRWCSMAVCGNRAKQSLHRQRARMPQQSS